MIYKFSPNRKKSNVFIPFSTKQKIMFFNGNATFVFAILTCETEINRKIFKSLIF